ncbi:hypothetical protein ACIUXL_18375 [Pseudomonas aeruginosa]|nr:hypothetical protein [Pseudomonas aeruginosa]MDP5959033.1 hypothetical protein [Pseudomonas aeruginosa]
MSLAIPMPERPRRARGRLQLLAIIGLVVVPMLLASAMYKWNFWVPQGRSYSGALIGNGQTPADLGVQGRSQGEQWQLLVTAPGTCGEDCQQLVYLARQVNIALGREASRAGHALAASGELPADFANLVRQDYPRLQRYGLDPALYDKAGGGERPLLWVVDPHGNLVLRYDAKANGKKLLKDVQLLLKLSHIG